MAFSSTAKVGIITIIALIAFGMVAMWKTDIFMVKEGYKMTGSFENIEGLTVGSEVRYRGFKVGKILRIDPTPTDIVVYSVINKDIKFPEDSHLRVAYDGIVGQKYLEIRPGTSEIPYQAGKTLEGIKTSSIVDFVDIGAQNLEETKAILISIRSIIGDPTIQQAFKHAVYTADKAAIEIDRLAAELRETNEGIRAIVADPKFQQNVKGTVSETHKTLESANTFFESFSNLNLKPSADVQYGSVANVVRGNIDIVQSQKDYLRLGIGEGPTRDLGLQDILISRQFLANWAMHLGMINSRLGGGLDVFPSEDWVLSGDIYDISNPKPNVPKIRVTSAHELVEYLDLLLQADDIFNSDRNYLFGVRIKGTN